MADYIERQAAFNMMFSRANPYGGQEKVNPADIWNQAATIIRTMPDSSVREDVHGEWVLENTREKSYMRVCSVCKRTAYCCTPVFSYCFCPNCGARMDGGESK